MSNPRPSSELAEELKKYATKHRMQFGRTPENDLLYEITQHLENESFKTTPSKTPAKKAPARSKKTQGETK